MFRAAALWMLLWTAAVSPLSAEPASSILSRAYNLIGQPYRSGGIAPGGFDCSGFVSYLFRPTLPGLPRMSGDMARTGDPVDWGHWRPGDLLFYATGSDPSRINHVAMWFGDGLIIHSISDGPETGVVITPADARYWHTRYTGARRVLPADEPAAASSAAPGSGIPGGTTIVPPRPSPPEKTEPSPWDTFEGILRGDFDAWKQADQDAFEAYKKENG